MVESGDAAPEFTVPMATPANAAGVGEYTSEDVEVLSLSEGLGDGPIVLAFFPGAFSRTCTQELCEFRDWRADLGSLNAHVYGVSADTPWSLLAFINQYDINYPLLSGFNNDIIQDYGMKRRESILSGIADRGVFVIDGDGTVIHDWKEKEPRQLPDFEAIRGAIEAV